MRASAVVATALSGGRTILPVLRSDPPLTLRQTDPHTVHLVSTAAGPLGGDHLALDLDVAPGTHLEIGSIASTLVLPGEGESLFVVTARVGEGALLSFTPEPTVLAAGCAHRMEVRLTLAEGARVRWREEIVFGRYGEAPGRCVARFDATVEGRPLLRQELAIGDPALDGSPAVYGPARCIGTTLLTAPPHRTTPEISPTALPIEKIPAGDAASAIISSEDIAWGGVAPEGVAPGSATPGSAITPGSATSGGVASGGVALKSGAGGSVVAEGVAVLPLAGPGVLVSALAADAVELRRRLDWGEAQTAW
ncbi:urease accessory protein UreD [Nonomuraea africana]|uniref:Urease accessory protein UreD n=1 Tax=Nonomuraea africana TaxID=46171 RepID=A0ABR9KK19_9ACTN|nr:urease accessory protein UreD [Nonomuraea africana]MBE1562351.1 urease accessory protein [Nonomuraea africana]